MRLAIDGGIFVDLDNYRDNSDDISKNVIISEFGTCRKTSITLHKHNIDVASLQNSSIQRVLCIGESTTASNVSNPYSEQDTGCWGWPSAIKMFSQVDRHNNVGAEIITIGTRHNHNKTFEYKGTTYTIRSFNEGYSGFPSYCLLNWPCTCKFTISNSTGFGAQNMWYILGLASKTPYNQSSYNQDRIEFDYNNAEHVALLTTTPFGKYKVDGDSTLWELLKKIGGTSGFPAFSGTGDYNGNSEQIELMNSWAESLADNPITPFYDKTEARTGNSGTAFSLNKYLEMYRTMDDSGNRLIGNAGDTVTGTDGKTYIIGTRVTNTSDYDVCTPTHVIINVGINDSESKNTTENAEANIKKFVSLFNVPVAYFITRYPGVSCPGLWATTSISRQYSPNVFCIELIENLIPWFEQQVGKTLLPILQIQYPSSEMVEYMDSSLVLPLKRVNSSFRNLHPGYDAYRSIGCQCLHWIYANIQ